MEQIIYCQDQVYRSSLQKVRENETEEEKKKKKSSDSRSPEISSESSLLEILQHLTAYRQVSACLCHPGGAHAAFV